MNIKRILVPYDFSECSVAALDYAARLASDATARLYVVYVDELLDARISAFPPVDGPGAYESSWDKRRHKVMSRLRKIVPHNSAANCEHHFLIGFPADEILEFADRVHANLIVMGSHGRTGFSRLMTGSVAEKVMRGSKCPVLIVKPICNPIRCLDQPFVASTTALFSEGLLGAGWCVTCHCTWYLKFSLFKE